jgi:hypothetical protein
MEKLALERGICGTRPAIDLIPKDWMADEGKMDSNLVRATGLDRDLEQCGDRKSLDDAEPCYRRPPRPQYSHTLPVLGIAADRSVNGGFCIAH